MNAGDAQIMALATGGMQAMKDSGHGTQVGLRRLPAGKNEEGQK